ncbi:MAG TPA: class I SAM-dependent methyltransferase [Candidatus Acidoferrum sp.]|nr:class I SAM-dependent methyltransferase [Candidatus Acidoferrum sp.]
MSTPQPTSPQAPPSGYAMGYTEAERARLMRQAKLFEKPTREIFLSAGLSSGMRVLDFGCGMGDVALLAASIVGPDGQVTGVDRDARAIECARLRVGNSPVRFEVSDLDGLASLASSHGPFDAVVGRLVLCHQPHPVAALRTLAPFVRPGGLIVFVEPELGIIVHTNLARPESIRIADMVKKTLHQAGVQMGLGTQLPRIFYEAGLGWPDTSLHLVMGSGEEFDGYGFWADTVRSLLPLTEKFGIATAAEVDVATVAERLRRELGGIKSSLICAVHVGAWVRTPAAPSS